MILWCSFSSFVSDSCLRCGHESPTLPGFLELQVIGQYKSSSICCFHHVRQTGFFLDILPMGAEVIKLLAELALEWLPDQLESNLETSQGSPLSSAKNGLGIRTKTDDVYIDHRDSMYKAFMVREQFLVDLKLRQYVTYASKHIHKLLKVFSELARNLKVFIRVGIWPKKAVEECSTLSKTLMLPQSGLNARG